MPASYPVQMYKKGNGSVGWLTEDTVEAAGQAYKAGNVVKVAASGAVTILTTGNGTAILGIAQSDATGVTGTKAIVEIIQPRDFVQFTLVNNSTTPVVGTLADLYKKYRMYQSGGETYLDKSSATGAAFQIVAILKDTLGVYTKQVVCTPIATGMVVGTGL
jgi:hypothetical protein